VKDQQFLATPSATLITGTPKRQWRWARMKRFSSYTLDHLFFSTFKFYPFLSSFLGASYDLLYLGKISQATYQKYPTAQRWGVSFAI